MKKRLFLCILINFIFIVYILMSYYIRDGIRCPIYQSTGIYCALCGATRSTWAILNRNFVAAYHYNAFYFFMLPYFIPRYIYSWYQYIRTKKINLNIDFWLIFLVAILFIIARNTFLPELKPTKII